MHSAASDVCRFRFRRFEIELSENTFYSALRFVCLQVVGTWHKTMHFAVDSCAVNFTAKLLWVPVVGTQIIYSSQCSRHYCETSTSTNMGRITVTIVIMRTFTLGFSSTIT